MVCERARSGGVSQLLNTLALLAQKYKSTNTDAEAGTKAQILTQTLCPGAVSAEGGTYVQHVEQGGGVLATDAGGQMYLLAHQTPAQLEDAAATHFLMAGQNVRAVCDVALGGRSYIYIILPL
jgi:hypothetical protein